MARPNAENPTGAKTSPVVLLLAILLAIAFVSFLGFVLFGPQV